MNTISTVEIPIDKRKVALWLIGLILLGVFGFWYLQNITTFSTPFVKVKGFGYGAVLCFILMGPFYIYKLFDKKPGFIISEEGITDNSSMTSHGFIPWLRIAGIGEVQISRKCVTVEMMGPQEYIDNASSWFKRVSWGGAYKKYGAPIILSNTLLRCSYDELRDALKDGLNKYDKYK